MALINHEKKYIFFHLYKCGGNSLRSILDGNEYGGGHCTPSDVKQMLQSVKANMFDDYFKFTIVRNPFDWLLSTYYYIIKTNHGLRDIVSKMDLHQFLIYYVNDMMLNTGKPVGGNKVVTLHQYITDDYSNVLLNYVGKYETINEDTKIICEKIGVPYKELPFINVNSNKEKDYRKYYDADTIKFIEENFAKDLEFFNYKF